MQEGLWLSSPLAAGIGSAPLAVLRANNVIFFVSREQTLGQELGFDGALRGGSVRRKGQSACELIAPRRCPMRGSLDAVHLQEPARSVRHTKPYRALRKKVLRAEKRRQRFLRKSCGKELHTLHAASGGARIGE